MPNVLLTIASALLLATPGDPAARAVLDTAVARMGGLAALQSVERMQVEVMTEWQRITLDGRAPVPVSSYELSRELRDYTRPAWRYSRQFFAAGAPRSLVMNLITDSVAATGSDGAWRPQNVAYVEERDEAFTFAPERVVLLAAQAADARALPDTVIDGVRHARVSATLGRFTPTLYFRRSDGMLARVHFRRGQPDDFGLVPWGDMDVDIWYSRWAKVPGAGVVLATQLDVYRVGRPYKRMTAISLKVNPPISADSLTMPDSLRAAFLATARKPMYDLPIDSARIQENAFAVFSTPGTPAGAVKVGGRWVMIEGGVAPLSVARSAAFLHTADPASPLGGAIFTAPAGTGGVAWLMAQSVPMWAAGAAQPYVNASIRGYAMEDTQPKARDASRRIRIGLIRSDTRSETKPKALDTSRWIRVGGDSLRVEIIDIPDYPQTAVVYVPSLKWAYAFPAMGGLSLDYVTALVRSRGWNAERVGSARNFTGVRIAR